MNNLHVVHFSAKTVFCNAFFKFLTKLFVIEWKCGYFNTVVLYAHRHLDWIIRNRCYCHCLYQITSCSRIFSVVFCVFRLLPVNVIWLTKYGFHTACLFLACVRFQCVTLIMSISLRA